MKDSIMLVLKGFVLGIANVIPGISGGTIAITLGIYERIIEMISHFTKKLKENIKFLLLLGSGILIAIALFSNIIGYSLDNFPFATILFFIGFILGGMPVLFKKVKSTFKVSNVIIFIITFALVMLMTFINAGTVSKTIQNVDLTTIIILFSCGLVGAASMVLPGISGSFVLMLLGYYEPIINTIRSLTKFQNIVHNVLILGVFGIGVLAGIIGMAKLIEWLLKKYEIKTYWGIIGFVIASIISIFISAINSSPQILEIVIGIVLLLIGMLLSNKMSAK